jgi:hypothetical protein
VAVKKSVFDALARKFRGIHTEPVDMVQDPRLRSPKRASARNKPRVWLPYSGPELVELWLDHVTPFLPATTTQVDWHCDNCGREPRSITGVETKSHRYDQNKKDLVPDVHPRAHGQGVFVAAANVKDHPIFRLEEFSGSILCTDKVKSFIESEGFTNVDFLEYGDVV